MNLSKNIKTGMLGTSLFLFILTAGLQCCKKDKEIIDGVSLIEEGEELSGGATTTFDVSFNAFGNAAPNIPPSGDDQFVLGNSFFRNSWVIAPSSTTARDGLGPLQNAVSCSGCHSLDGRGKPEMQGNTQTGLLIRLSIPGADIHGGPLPDPNYGGQLSNRSIPGVKSEGDVVITYTDVVGFYEDGTQYKLRKPNYTFVNLNYGPMAGNILFSPRVGQQLPGLGLLEAVEEATLLGFADEFDANQDGISGRPNYVWDYDKNKESIGRFGWKANQPGLKQQIAGAFLGDIGITSSLFPDQNLSGEQVSLYSSLANGGSPEIADNILENVVYYNSTLAVPARRNWKDSTVIKGKLLFNKAKCSSCHIPKMQTGTHPFISELSNQVIRPYTDLLLHDMGPGLADNRPDFKANGQEWRTPPLWGIGLIKTVNNHTFLLHDGRARNFEEAILWHGGEAENAKKAFVKMSQSERQAIIKFLESL